jgi:hypothetical protein
MNQYMKVGMTGAYLEESSPRLFHRIVPVSICPEELRKNQEINVRAAVSRAVFETGNSLM